MAASDQKEAIHKLVLQVVISVMRPLIETSKSRFLDFKICIRRNKSEGMMMRNFVNSLAKRNKIKLTIGQVEKALEDAVRIGIFNHAFALEIYFYFRKVHLSKIGYQFKHLY